MPIQHYTTETYRAHTSVGYLLKRAHSLLIDYVEPVVATEGLTFTQWVVLMHLRDGLTLTPTTLCAQLRHDSGALTRLIDQLESRGLVHRERSRRDRRAVQLQLTDAGRERVEALVPRVVQQLNVALAPLTVEELSQLVHLLDKLVGEEDKALEAVS